MIKIKDLYLKKKIPEISNLNLHVNDGESYVLLSSNEIAIDHLINIFLGLEREFKGILEIDKEKLQYPKKSRKAHPFVYLNAARDWPPDMKVYHLISFLKSKMKISEDDFETLYIELNLESMWQKQIGELEEVEWRKILFYITRHEKCKNFIFREYVKGMPLDFNIEFTKRIKEMKKSGCAILYFSNDVFLAPEVGDRVGFMKKGKLLLELKASKMKKMSLQELYFKFLAED